LWIRNFSAPRGSRQGEPQHPILPPKSLRLSDRYNGSIVPAMAAPSSTDEGRTATSTISEG